MHNWSDEDCVKIPKRCREAIKDEDEGRKGKVLIIDMVLDRDEVESDMTEVKLIFDVMMMVLFTGRQRTEKEWEKLFFEAGFMSYKIRHVFGLRFPFKFSLKIVHCMSLRVLGRICFRLD